MSRVKWLITFLKSKPFMNYEKVKVSILHTHTHTHTHTCFFKYCQTHSNASTCKSPKFSVLPQNNNNHDNNYNYNFISPCQWHVAKGCWSPWYQLLVQDPLTPPTLICLLFQCSSSSLKRHQPKSLQQEWPPVAELTTRQTPPKSLIHTCTFGHLLKR